MTPHPSNHQWYVAYTYPQAERKVDRKLNEIGMTTFLPLQRVVRQWSDRKKKMDVPLFPNYIFVCTSPQKRFDVFKVKEVVKLVSFGGQPATVADATIDSLERMQAGDIDVTSKEFYEEGTAVKIEHGQFAGAEGVVARRSGKQRLVVYVKVLNTYVSVDMSANNVEAIGG